MTELNNILNLKINQELPKMFNNIEILDKIGVGTDIEDIERFHKYDSIKQINFLNKIFTKNELEYCLTSQNPAQHFAARFAGKEAIYKAINSIKKVFFNFKNVEILNTKLGAPKVNLLEDHLDKWKIYLSLSHCEEKALAFAIAIMLDS